jgi:acetylornithine deacetylase/succinyl-diaminopimelate desuccinylase-like protein
MRPKLRSLSLATLAALALPGLSFADDALAPYDAKAREIFAKAISIPTSQGLGKVPELANYLAGEFRKAGFPEADVHVLPLGETASLVVRFRGDGSGGRPILLMAHMDVVTAKREDWQRDPFTLVEENGFFYGRGTEDIKQGVTELTATFLRLKQQGFVPSRDLIIYFSGDEETDGNTAQDTVKNHHDLVDAEFALNADGGGGNLDEEDGSAISYSLQTAEKTYASFELTTHNPGGHSSAPGPDNAIYELADALQKLHAFQFPVMWNDTTIAYYKANAPRNKGALGKAMADFAANPKDEAAVAVLRAEAGEVGKTGTTCVATLLRGGHAENALPQSATATVNCRIFPGHAVDDVKATLAKVAGDKVTVTTIGKPFPAPASPLRQDVLDAVTYAVHALHPGIPIVPSQSSGASDGIYFRAGGIPTYGTGSSFIKDSDDFSHGLNERIPVASFYQDLRHWDLLIKALAGPKPK